MTSAFRVGLNYVVHTITIYDTHTGVFWKGFEEYFCPVLLDFFFYPPAGDHEVVTWGWPSREMIAAWHRLIEKEEWARVFQATGNVSSLLPCFMALWPCLHPSSTMSSSFTMWRRLCLYTRSIKSPSGWERWVCVALTQFWLSKLEMYNLDVVCNQLLPYSASWISLKSLKISC